MVGCVFTGIAFSMLAQVAMMGASAQALTKEPGHAEVQIFEALREADWQSVFYDPCTNSWQDHWVLDGLKAEIENTPAGMDFSAGPVHRDNSCHAVLWTKESFEGDLRIDYEYTKLDDETRNVTIIYIQATGTGEGVYDKDILKWSRLREVPTMSLYFNNMNTYHISYAAFGMENEDPEEDYIRARRYMPEKQEKLSGTDLQPDYLRTGLFEKGVPHHITIIKKGDDLFMQVRNAEKEMLCHWKTDDFPPIQEGRIGLRHMFTRNARYRDFKVSRLPRLALP